MFLNRSYSHMDVLTKASITLLIIEDVAIYKAQIFSSNGNIFGMTDKSTDIHLTVWKGPTDITDRFDDIVWRRFTSKESGYEEDLTWGEQYRNLTSFTLTRKDINERAKIQAEVYGLVNGVRQIVAIDYINFIDVNDLQGSPTPPDHPKHGDLWLDMSVTPPKLMMWDENLQMWIEITVAGKDRRNLVRNSNFYKATFDNWETVGKPNLQIESFKAKKWARIKSNTSNPSLCGIRQIVGNISTKSDYTFQMLSEVYIQSIAPEGNALVSFYSIDDNGIRTFLKEEVHDIRPEAYVYTTTFTTLESTKKVEITISGEKNKQFDFVVTNIKLENNSIATEWELAIEDLQDALDNKLSNSHEDIFNSLTDDGKIQGLYTDVDDTGKKNFYFNASYIKTGKLLGEHIEGRNLVVTNDKGSKTLEITDKGEVNIRANSISIGTNTVATTTTVAQAIQKAIKSVDIMYYLSNSSSTVTGGHWQTLAPAWQKNRYIWTKTVTVYMDDTIEETEPVCISGVNGQNGSDGKGIKSIVEQYYLSTSTKTQSGGEWSNTVPTWTSGKYMWTRSVITYTDDSVTTTDPICVSGTKGDTGAKGDKGDKGATGAAGVGISNVDVEYYLSSSSTNLADGTWTTTAPTWVNGKYMWSRTKTVTTNGTVTYSDPVCITGAKGSTGAAGATGQGVASITEEYYLSTSKTTQTGGSWVTTPPTWSAGKYMWTRSKIVYKNPTSTVYTTPICDSSWEAVNEINIGGRNLITKDINNISKWTMKYPDRMSITNNGYDNTYILKTASGGWETVISNGITVTPNKEHVLSFEYEVFKNYTCLSPYTFRVEVLKEKTNENNASAPYAIAYHTIENVVTAKKRVFVKFTPTVSTVYLMINAGYINDNQTDLKFSFNKFKLEIGNKATDWTPAPEDIDNAINDVNTKVETTSSKVAELKIDTDSIAQRVASTETTLITTTNTANNALNKVDGLQIGGRNIASGTNKGISGWMWNMASGGRSITEVVENGIRCCKMVRDNTACTSWSYIGYSQIGRNKYVAGRTYTVSFEVKSSVPTSFWCHFLEGNSSNGMHTAGAKATVSEINKWTKLVFTLTMKDTLPTSTSQLLYLNSMDSSVGVTYIFRNLMIEEGTKASAWTPAPEDIDNAISNVDTKIETTKSQVAEIVTNLDSINLKVQSTEKTVSSHTTQLGQVDNKINNAVNNLQVGGRNLIPNSAPKINNYGWAGAAGSRELVTESTAPFGYAMKATFTANATSQGGMYAAPKTKLVPGKIYSWSVWLKASKSMIINVGMEQNGRANCAVTTSWQQFTHKFTANDHSNYAFVMYAQAPLSTGDYYLVHSIMVEEGNKPGSWSPAPEDVDSAIANVNTKIESTTSKLSELKLETDRITQRVQSTESTITTHTNQLGQVDNKVTNAINNLQIGGKNLLWNSSFTKNADKWDSHVTIVTENNKLCAKLTGSFKQTVYAQQSILNKVVPNQQYTVSGWVKVKNITFGSTNPTLMFYVDGQYNNNGNSTWYGYGAKYFDRTVTEWQYVTWTFTTDNKLNTAKNCYFFVYCRDFTGEVFFYNLKLEKGNKATDWSPAPEDIDSSISNVNTKIETTTSKLAELKLETDRITQRVSATETTTSTLTTNVNNKEDKNNRVIYAKGTGNDFSANRVLKVGNKVIYDTGGRGARVTALVPSTLAVHSDNTYDLHVGGDQETNFINKINELNNGDYIIVVTSCDNAYLHYRLRCEALYKIGGFAPNTSIDAYREAYALIGRSKLGKGNGVEMYIPKTATDKRFAEVSVKVNDNGAFMGVNSSNIGNQLDIVDNKVETTKSRVSEIATTVDSINLKVQSTEQTVNSQGNQLGQVDKKVNTSISQIEMLNNKIGLTVQKNNVISSINLYTQDNENGTSSGVKIRGDKIDLQGQVTFSSLADSNVSGSIKNIFTQQNNQTVINGGMIKTNTIKGNDLLLKGNLTVSDNGNNKTFEITSNGEVNIQAKSLRIGSSNVATNRDVNNAIDNIQVGSRNLLRMDDVVNFSSTNFTRNQYSVTCTHNSQWEGIVFYNLVNSMELNQDYIVQYKIKKTAGSLVCIAQHVDSQFVVSDFTVDGVSRDAVANNGANMGINDSNWHTCILKIKRVTNTDGNGSGTTNRIVPQPNRGLNTSVSVEMKDFKIEKGNKITDWTPAPEDINSAINRTIKTVDVMYYSSTSSSTVTGGSWQTLAPAWQKDRYIWTKTVTTYMNNTNSETTPVCISGVNGQNGANGSNGKDGKGIKSIVEQYYLSTSNSSQAGGSWVTTPPAWTNGRYMWTRSVVTYTDNSTMTTNPVCVSGSKGDTGATGATGPQGAAGIGIKSVDVEYYLSTSSTSLSGGTWSTTAPAWTNGRYMWSRTKTVNTAGTTIYSNAVCITGSQGQTGSTGATGQGVSSITEEYYLSTSKTAQSGGSWVTTPPAWSIGKYVWTRSKIVYKNPTSTAYTTPVCDSSWEAINDVEIGGRNLAKKGCISKYNTASDTTVTDTNFLKDGSAIVSRTAIVNEGPIIDRYTVYEAGKEYVISFKLKTNAGTVNSIHIYNGCGHTNSSVYIDGTYKGALAQDLAFPTDTNYHKVEVYFKAGSANRGDGSAINTTHTILQPIKGTASAYTVQILNFKIEKGNKPTDWSPAPEDTSAAINNKVDNTQSAIFNKLFANGQQGFVLENGKVYINGEVIKADTISGNVIKAGTLDAGKIKTGIIQASSGGSYLNLNNGSMMLGTIDNSNYLQWTGSSLNIKANYISIGSNAIATTVDVNNAIKNVQSSISNKVDNTQSAIFNTLFANGQQGFVLESGKVYINGEVIKANTISGSVIKAGTLDASKITTGSLSANVIKGSAISAINMSTESAVISSAKIGNLDASKITSGTISANRLDVTHLISKINESSTSIKGDRIRTGTIQANSGGSYFNLNNGSMMLGSTSNSNYLQWSGVMLKIKGKLEACEMRGKNMVYIEDNGILSCDGQTYIRHLSVLETHPGWGSTVRGSFNCAPTANFSKEVRTSGEFWARNNSGDYLGVIRRGAYKSGVIQIDRMRVINEKHGSANNYIEVACYNSPHVFGIDLWGSDTKLKENIVSVEDDNNVELLNEDESKKIGLDLINNLNHYAFDYKKNFGGDHVTCGYVAQELQELNDTLVMAVEQQDDTVLLQPKASNIIPNLSLAIKQQQKMIEDLKEEIELLKSKLNN